MRFAAIIVSPLLLGGALAQSSTSVVSLIFGPTQSGYGYVGSVINADASRTTYALACTSAPTAVSLGLSNGCLTGTSFTLTSASDSYSVVRTLSTLGGVGVFDESCTIKNTATATCVFKATASANGASESSTITATTTDLQSHFNQFTLTAGLEKLAGASTRTSHNAAAPTVNAAKAAAVIIPGMAVLAGAML